MNTYSLFFIFVPLQIVNMHSKYLDFACDWYRVDTYLKVFLRSDSHFTTTSSEGAPPSGKGMSWNWMLDSLIAKMFDGYLRGQLCLKHEVDPPNKWDHMRALDYVHCVSLIP